MPAIHAFLAHVLACPHASLAVRHPFSLVAFALPDPPLRLDSKLYATALEPGMQRGTAIDHVVGWQPSRGWLASIQPRQQGNIPRFHETLASNEARLRRQMAGVPIYDRLHSRFHQHSHHRHPTLASRPSMRCSAHLPVPLFPPPPPPPQ